jgi:Mrp family chromosome partitioning ATPase
MISEHDLPVAEAVGSAAQRWRERLGRPAEPPPPGAAQRWRERLSTAEAARTPSTAQRWRERFSRADAPQPPASAPGWFECVRRGLPSSWRITPTPALGRESVGERAELDAARRGRPMFPDAQIPPALDPASALMEACRVLRCNLAAGQGSALRQLAVIAPASDPACALVATGLALALAEEGNRTLLVDADLRAPLLHQLFALDPTPGLADLLLANDLSHLRPIQVTGHLSTLPAGATGRGPAVLFRLPALGRVTAALAQQYDAVIYHISGQWTMPDALVFAPHVGAAMFTIRAGIDTAEQIKRTKEPLERAGVRILGFAMIGEPQES